jgi:hypothetical protein
LLLGFRNQAGHAGVKFDTDGVVQLARREARDFRGNLQDRNVLANMRAKRPSVGGAPFLPGIGCDIA